jgi:aryl carrier-like protein
MNRVHEQYLAELGSDRTRRRSVCETHRQNLCRQGLQSIRLVASVIRNRSHVELERTFEVHDKLGLCRARK